MIYSFDDWYDKNADKLEEDYQEYLDIIDDTIIVPNSFDEYCLSEYESYVSEYDDIEYERYKDEQ